jgi:hypothetical protein
LTGRIPHNPALLIKAKGKTKQYRLTPVNLSWKGSLRRAKPRAALAQAASVRSI